MYEILSQLTLISIGFFIILAFRVGPISATGHRELISSYNVVVISFTLYTFISAALSVVFNDFEFTWARNYSGAKYALPILLLCLFSFLTFVFSYRLFFRLQKRRSNRHIIELPELSSSGYVIALAILAVGLGMKLEVLRNIGGVDSALLRLSGGIKASLGLGRLDAFTIMLLYLSTMADAAACWLSLEAMRKHRGTLAFLTLATLATIVVLFTFALTGKRLFLLVPGFSIVIGYSVYIRRIRISTLPVFFVVIFALGMGSLFSRVFVPANLSYVNIDLQSVHWAQGSLLRFYLYSLEFSYFEMLTLIVFDSHGILDFLGGYWTALYRANLEPFLYVVPRAVWPGKPALFMDVSHGITLALEGGGMTNETGGINSTLIGTSWAFGGIVGVVIGMLLLSWVAARSDNFLRLGHKVSSFDIIVFANMVVIVFHLFRQGTIGWVFLIFVTSQFSFIFATAVIHYGGRLTGVRSRLTRS